MKLCPISDSYLNVSGNCYDPDFINLTRIDGGRIYFDSRVLFLSQTQKEKLNRDAVRNYKNAAFLVRRKNVYSLVADIDIDEYKNGRVKTHELVIPDTVQGMLANFNIYNTETQPVLLIHKEHLPLGEYAAKEENDGIYTVKDTVIYVYLGDRALRLLEMYNRQIGCLYVADGHHRLYSTSILRHKKTMLSCLTDMDDIVIYPIHRILRNIDAAVFGAAKKMFQSRKMIADSRALKKGIVRITYGDETLYVRLSDIDGDEFWNNDVLRLNTQILTVAFRINDFSDLSFVSGNDFERGDYTLGRNDVLLEVCAPTLCEFVGFIDRDQVMPPKSTCFEPKFPSFLIMKKYK